MIRKEADADFINRIVNSPAVRPFVDYTDGSKPLDVTPAVGRPGITGVVWLSNGEDAVAAFEQTADRDFQAHLFFADTCRGRRALEVGREMIAFLKPFADLLWGAIPTRNKAAIWFARALGFRVSHYDDFDAEGRVAIVGLRL